MVDTDDVVSVASEEIRSISRPSEGDAVGHLGVLADKGGLEDDVVDHSLGLQIPDLDAGGGGSDQPVSVGGEDKRVDDVAGLQLVQLLALREIPEHGSSVFSTRGAERAIGGDSDGVEVAVVSDKVVSELAGLQGPDLDELVPASRDDHWGGRGRRESDAGDPVRVAFLLDGEQALAKSVPELEGSVTGGRDDLSVVGGEGNGQNILGVAGERVGDLALLVLLLRSANSADASDELASADTGLDLPKTKGGIP